MMSSVSFLNSAIIPVEERISTRSFPSVFQVESPIWIEGVSYEDRKRDPELVPYHDLLIGGYAPYGDGNIEVRLEDVIFV